MPGYDKKGPNGEGPMTGRKLGYCSGNISKDENPEQKEYGIGRERTPRGSGKGRCFRRNGRGRGLQRRINKTIDKE